jgi:hypothetical protein
MNSLLMGVCMPKLLPKGRPRSASAGLQELECGFNLHARSRCAVQMCCTLPLPLHWIRQLTAWACTLPILGWWHARSRHCRLHPMLQAGTMEGLNSRMDSLSMVNSDGTELERLRQENQDLKRQLTSGGFGWVATLYCSAADLCDSPLCMPALQGCQPDCF